VTWPVVARRDLRELLAEKTLYYFCALFALVGGGVASIAARGQAPTRLSHLVALLFLFATPPLAVTFVQQAIPRSVTTGRIRLTLSLPHSRAAFVAGVGAAAVVAALAVTAAGVLGAVAMYLVRGAPVDLLGLVPVLALLVLLAAAFVGATLAFTARSRSTTLSVATGYGLLLLAFFWPVAVSLSTVVLGSTVGVPVPGRMVNTVTQLSPVFAYQNAVSALGLGIAGPVGHIPEWGGVVVLLAWAGLGYALAARRFGGIDL